MLGILCSEDRAVVDALGKTKVQVAESITEHYWEYDGTQWSAHERSRGAAHTGRGEVILQSDRACWHAAYDLIHEMRHHAQPAGMTPAEVEVDAYTFGEQWAIDRGLPGRTDFRVPPEGDAKKETIDAEAVKAYVAKRYSGAAAGAPAERVIGHDGTDAEVRRADGTTYKRPAQTGESHQDIDKTAAGLANLPAIDPKRWVCPALKKPAGGAAKP